VEEVLAAFDEHLRRTRGVCAGTRRNYARFAGAFLQAVFAGGPVVPAEIHVRHVVGFVAAATRRCQPRTVELAASALRSFFRFLRAEGLRADRLEDAVPVVPHRPAGLVRHLDPGRFGQLIASLDSSSPRGSGTGQSSCAWPGWGCGPARSCSCGWRIWTGATPSCGYAPARPVTALLPLTAQVGTALAVYLQHGRPDTPARQVFVLHRLRTGAPISASIVGRAVDNALRQAGIDAPMRGGNLLRHSLATDLLGRGASLPEIAGLFGHSSLATTRIYAAVDVAALREVALPWPEATS
jgi:integrase/recombinase XerD